MPKVLNKRIDKIPSDAVYIGRPSKWGNPFKLNDPSFPKGLSMLGKRRMAISKYREWLLRNGELTKCLHELKGKDLVCWCAPLPCHGDVLLELANPVQGRLKES